MSNDKNAFKAGLFILISLALGVTIFVMIRGAGSFFSPMRRVQAAFMLDENLGGLKVGDTVRVGGYDQGRVTDIQFINDNGKQYFAVTFTLPAHYDLRADAVVQVEQGLTGTANLNISHFGSGPAWTDGTILDGRPSALSEFYAIAPEARGLLTDVRAKIGPGYAKYESLATKYEGVADDARKTLKTADQSLESLRELFGDVKTDFRTLVANLSSMTTTLRERIPKTIDRIDTFLDTTTSAVEGARGAMEDIKVAAANTKDLTGEARSLLMRNRSRLDKIIESLRDTSINLEAASAEIRRSPWRLLYTPKPNEVANLNIYDTARQFAEAATALNDAAAALRDAAKDPQTTEEHLKALMESLDATFAKYKTVEQAMWQAVK